MLFPVAVPLTRGANVGFPSPRLSMTTTTTTTMPIPDHHHHRETDRRSLHHGSSRTTVPFPLLLPLLLLLSLLCSPAKAQPSGSSPQNPYGNLRGGFGPAMGIIVVIMVSVFFFIVFFSIYLRQCGERGDPSVAGRALQGLRSRRSAARGLDPSVIQTFPTLVYVEVKEHKIGKGALECAVCLSEFEDDETLRLLPKCDHVFHTDCIDVWLSSHTTCPVCRSNLDPNAAVTPAAAEAPADPPADAGSSAAAASEEEDTQRERGGAGGQPQDHVAIVVEEPEAGARMRRMESKSRLRWRWSRSLARPPRFWRSHSTGHSVAAVRPGEDFERYTLRLPDHIRRDVVAGKFQRSPSTSRKGHRAGGEGTGRGVGGGWSGPVGGRSFKLRKWEWAAKSDRWAFFARTLSMVVTRGDDGQSGEGSARRGVEAPSRKKGEEGGSAAAAATTTGVGEGSVKGKKVFPSGDV